MFVGYLLYCYLFVCYDLLWWVLLIVLEYVFLCCVTFAFVVLIRAVMLLAR